MNSDGVDAHDKRCVQATAGGVTAFLRNSWELNGILGDGPGKSRDDHRHHAIDAIVVALTDSGMIKKISSLAKQGRYNGRGRFDDLPLPWPGFHDEAAERINQVVTSHHVSRRVRGAMHQDTFYGRPREDDSGKRYVHIRKPLEALSEKDIPSIVDPVIRWAVQTKLQELREKPAAAFKLAKMSENAPTWKTGDGRLMPVLRTRIRQNLHTFPVGRGKTKRWVKPGRNHHMEVVELLDEDGKTIKWEGYPISMYEAHQRLLKGVSVVNRNHGPGKRFLFSIAAGEILELEDDTGVRRHVVIRSVRSNTQVRWMAVNDARIDDKLSKAGRTAHPDSPRKRDCRKIVVTPLGEIRRARD